MTSPQFLRLEPSGAHLNVHVFGEWVIHNAAALKARLDEVPGEAMGAQRIVFECSGLEGMDTSGAWILHCAARDLEAQGFQTELRGLREEDHRFFQRVVAGYEDEKVHARRPHETFLAQIQRMGEWAVLAFLHLGQVTAFLLRLAESLLICLLVPFRLRVGAIVNNMLRAGVTAIPIIALLAFLISIVLSYQGATQLARFGAEIFTVNLTVVSLLREMGVLLTAILVAGRSGSAFAAEIGVMKLNEEIDAMQTIGLDPYEVLILPRIVALVIMLPLLTVLADLVGLAGGALSAYLLMGLSLDAYLAQVQSALTPWTFWVGIFKAPVFAFLIASTGTFYGLQVSTSAESVGRYTTVAVVQSIFLVIAADAAFSILFTRLGI